MLQECAAAVTSLDLCKYVETTTVPMIGIYVGNSTLSKGNSQD